MAAIFAFEISEALRIVREPDFYIAQEDPDMEAGKIWVGPADDIILRKRGVEFVDGSAPGFAAIVGAAPNPEIAKMIVEDYQKRNLYIFCAAQHNGTSVIEQLISQAFRSAGTPVSFPLVRISLPPYSPLVLPTERPWPSVAFSPAITRKY